MASVWKSAWASSQTTAGSWPARCNPASTPRLVGAVAGEHQHGSPSGAGHGGRHRLVQDRHALPGIARWQVLGHGDVDRSGSEAGHALVQVVRHRDSKHGPEPSGPVQTGPPRRVNAGRPYGICAMTWVARRPGRAGVDPAPDRRDGANLVPGARARWVPGAVTEALRSRLVDRLGATGRLRRGPLRDAFLAVPRHLFLPGVDPEGGRTRTRPSRPAGPPDGRPTSSSSQPAIVAAMLEQRLAGTAGAAGCWRSAAGPAGTPP